MELHEPAYRNCVVIGANGALGGAFIRNLASRAGVERIHAFSRSDVETISPLVSAHAIDYEDEASIRQAANLASTDAPLDLVIVATGLLHADGLMPEKSLRELSADKFQQLFMANTIVPALMAKHFLPHMCRETRSVFAVLSARVGSISDNRLGGWYAYRASKAALNMVVKNAAIEMERRYDKAIVAGLHPGTVDSGLSQPFQAQVPEGKLFTPEFSAARLLAVLDQLTPEDSGKCFAWDEQEIQP